MPILLKKILKFGLPLCAVALAGYAFLTLRQADSLALIHPVSGPAVQAIYATGTVEPSIMVPISAKSSAILLSFSADEGENVTKGQILGQLEDNELQTALIEMQSLADLAEKEFARRFALGDKKAVSQQSVDQARSNLDVANARVAQAEASLEHMQLTAPEDGIIIRRDGEIGELIAANKPVFWMSCCAGLRIAAEVDEEDIAFVKIDQNVVIRADAFPGQIFEGKVQSITPKGDPVSRSYRVRISLDSATPLMIGMTAETNIILRKAEKALLIPPSCVSENAVWLFKNGKLVSQAVTIGAKTATALEITRGIGPDDLVVLNAVQVTDPDHPPNTRIDIWKAP